MRTSDLGAVWGGFLRLKASDRREFVERLKARSLQRRTALVAQRGGGTLHRGAKDFSDLTLDEADLEREPPRAMEDALMLPQGY